MAQNRSISIDVLYLCVGQLIASCGGDKLSYLNQACRDAGAGRDDGLETAVVHHEVTHCNIESEEKKEELLNAKKSIQSELHYVERGLLSDNMYHNINQYEPLMS